MRASIAWLGCVAIVALTAVGARANLPTLSMDDAFKAAQESGRPIFAMAGNKTCPACQALESQLFGDPQVRGLLSSFVVVKIDTDDGGQAGPWLTKYPLEGNSIPQVIVARADGEKLQTHVGAPPQLAQFLQMQLSNAGQLFPPSELTKMAKAVEDAKALLSQGDPAKAIDKVAKYANNNCYAAPAIAVTELVKKLTEDANKALGDGEKQLQGDKPLDGAIAMLSAANAYGRLPDFAKSSKQTLNKLKRDVAYRETFRQADAIEQAMRLEKKSDSKRAIAAYRKVMDKFPNSPAAERAAEAMKKLGEDVGSLSAETADKPVAAEKDEPVAAVEKEEPAKPAATAKELRMAASNLKMAQAFAKKKNAEKTRQYAEKVIEQAPDSELAAEAKTLLEQFPGNGGTQ